MDVSASVNALRACVGAFECIIILLENYKIRFYVQLSSLGQDVKKLGESTPSSVTKIHTASII